MNIAFRVDASLDIGTGHVMRCLALADGLRAAGGRSCFLCRLHPGHLIAEIERRGHAVIALPVDADSLLPGVGSDGPPHAAWLGTDWSTDVQQTEVALGAGPIDWLIVDHYAIDARWQRAMRHRCRRLMVIDDLADRTHDCDVLLDQNLGRSAADYVGLTAGACVTLIGPRFALLRPEFAELRDYSLNRRATGGLNGVLVALGGVDNGDVTSEVLAALDCSDLPALAKMTVVMGSRAPHLTKVRFLAERMRRPCVVMSDVSNMAQLMADSDLGIGAAGSSSWERCCLGLPSMVLVVAENQREIARALALAGAARVIDFRPATARQSALVDALSLGPHGPAWLREASLAAASVADGLGVGRVVEILERETR